MPYNDPEKRKANYRKRTQDPEYLARIAVYHREWRAANPERAKDVARRAVAGYRARHPERIAEYKQRSESKAREAAWMAASRATNPERHREARLRQYRADPLASTRSRARAHGITVDEYLAMQEAQGGLCAICRQPERKRGSNGRVCQLAIDHDHDTGEIRGLLCHACNISLGLMDDDPERLDAAAGYLRAAVQRRLHIVKGG